MMEMLKSVDWVHIGYAIALVLIGFITAKRVSFVTSRTMSKRFSQHQAMLVRRLVFYGLFLIFLIAALQQVGFKMTVLLGAAGVFTVALSFASQTAASNLVSGIFLLFESPFKVGDTIRIKDIVGTVDSIDLLSTKIVNAENMLIRVPNETVIKSEILNMNFFKTRRVDILIGVGYEAKIDQVKGILTEIAKEQKAVLKTPEPQVIISNFADSAIELKLMVWTKTPDAFTTKNQINELIKRRFDEKSIDIPYPQMTVHKASQSE